jgi:hypothetical protein
MHLHVLSPRLHIQLHVLLHKAMPDWLTYAAAGERYGLSPGALRMRAHRLGWRTMPGNDGRTLVLVPDDAELQPRARAPERAPAQTDGSDLTDLLTEAENRAEGAEQRAAQAAHQAEQAVQRSEEANSRADAALALADRTLAQLADAAARADQADTDRRAAESRAGVADAALNAERQRVEALRDQLNSAERDLAVAQHDAKAAQQSAEVLRQADVARKARGRWSRLRAAWRGE